MPYKEELQRIRDALDRAREVLTRFPPGRTAPRFKSGGDPVTDADLAVDEALRNGLPRPGEGWLSEESADTPDRLTRERVWIVDPVDGTRQFVAGHPEWTVSIALVEAGRAVAGGICNPMTGESVVGALGAGVALGEWSCRVRPHAELHDADVLASRSEVRRGEWERFRAAPFRFRPVGSVAYKLALVAAGLADATWTLRPRYEWDVAAGAALVAAAGGEFRGLDGSVPTFNKPEPIFRGFVAASPALVGKILRFLDSGHLSR